MSIGLALITEEALMALGSDARVEIIDGVIVEMSPVGGLHHIITGNIYDLIKPFAKKNKLGLVFMDGLIYLMHKQGKGIRGALVPDVSFIRKDKIPADWELEKPFPGAPTLVIEVVSPDDAIEDVLAKVRQYLKAGTEQVWLVFPRQKEIHQYLLSAPNQVKIYQGADVIDCESLFPGLTLVAQEFFVLFDVNA